MSEFTKIPDIFAGMVFTEEKMQQRLSPEAYEAWLSCRNSGTTLSKTVAAEIAAAMKDWATELGATHYTHWFQPMTGFTAEKHDSFIVPDGDGHILMELSGKELTRGETDASSFPSGGLRATFEARGYTAWDPTSYAFVKDATLCIPTIFCSYSGDTLDKKTPLLRSMRALDKQCIRILRLFGNTKVQHVTSQIGPEQEYFLIDREMYEAREDLKLCGRTLFGARPPKGQELDDHYYGAIRPRVAAFMHELDEELWKLGVLAKTEHNEVAPAQHELAPIYTDANTACDHNQLTMEMLKKVAARHDLVCLLHEKPFAGVNGSGKHDNWSLQTDTGENLFKPGKTPSQNAQFLLFLVAFIRAVDEYQEMLRASVAYPGNDHRLGGHEAPPAVVSIFLGDELTAILSAIVSGEEYVDVTKRMLEVGVDVLPEIPQDTTDRNRTSPVAFTGNKFEFRMLGASQSIAGPTVILNTIMADVLADFADRLEGVEHFHSELQKLLRQTICDHRRILFDGNGYGEEWMAEAARRGLSNLDNAVDAIPAYIDPKNISLFSRHGVMTSSEMIARYEIHLENYCKVTTIEANTLLDMARRHILPAVSSYTDTLAQTVFHKNNCGLSVGCTMERSLLETLCQENDALFTLCCELEAALSSAPALDDGIDSARYYRDEVAARIATAATHINKLECLTSDEYWPFPTYADILFSV